MSEDLKPSGSGVDAEPAAADLTLAAAAIMDVFMGGRTGWRERMDQSEILESADWPAATSYARAALGAATASPTGDSDEVPGTPPDTSWNKRASPLGGEWRWVPVEPTEEMCGAGMLLSMDGPLIAMSEAEEVYRAMLSAAPPREAVGVGIEGASRTKSTDARCDATAEASSRKSEGEA